MQLKHITIVHSGMHFVGGAERLMTDLALGLADEETHVDLVTGVCHDFWRSLLSQKSSYISIKELGRPAAGVLRFWLNVGGFVKALSKLISGETDVILTSNFPSSLVAQSFNRTHCTLVVHYIHDAPITLLDKEGIKAYPLKLRFFFQVMRAFYGLQEIKAVQEGDLVLASSQMSKKANAKVYSIDENLVEVVYPGINVDSIVPSGAVPQLIRPYVQKGVSIIFVPKGAEFWRRQEVCLQALKLLGSTCFVAVFTGGLGFEVSSLFKRAKLFGVADKVLWVQSLPHDEVYSMYSYSSLIVSIAKRQGFGLIPLEASLCGTPSIVSYSSGVSEVLRDGVDTIKVHDDNPAELAEAIRLLLFDVEKGKKMAADCRRRVLEEFSIARFTGEVKLKLQKMAENQSWGV